MENVDLAGSTGWYPEDSFLTREIVRALEAAVQPLFLFAVSVEAHGPYEPSRFPNSTVKVEGSLDDDARAELITYVEAISHADRELGELVRYLERRGRPTVLVFFGDHLPSLPRVLAQTGLVESVAAIDSLDIARRSFLYEVPLVLWNNLKPGPRALGALSPSFLGPLLLEEIGIPGTPYMDF
jgi:arylsulfatase A-like enzyme